MHFPVDLTGKEFGRLLVLHLDSIRVTPSGSKRKRWKCACECGRRVVVDGTNLSTGHTKSCGCYRVEFSTLKSTKHGFISTQEKRRFHNIWVQLRQRCENPNDAGFYKYGGRGIAVCGRWQKFENFRDDMWPTYKPNLTIERKDNNGPYSPENCIWATNLEQSNNRRSNIRICLNGKTQNLTQWARELGVNSGSVISRITRGWRAQAALTVPFRKPQCQSR